MYTCTRTCNTHADNTHVIHAHTPLTQPRPGLQAHTGSKKLEKYGRDATNAVSSCTCVVASFVWMIWGVARLCTTPNAVVDI